MAHRPGNVTLNELRKRCQARLRTLQLPIPFDVFAFAHSLASQRGRPIRVQSVATLFGPHGLWLATEAADVIFYQQNTSPLHQDHIILHELSHLLCGHQAGRLAETDLPALLFPHISAGTVQRLLARTAYSTDDEREAELLASLIRERAAGQRITEPVTAPAEAEGLAGRLAASLEDV